MSYQRGSTGRTFSSVIGADRGALYAPEAALTQR